MCCVPAETASQAAVGGTVACRAGPWGLGRHLVVDGTGAEVFDEVNDSEALAEYLTHIDQLTESVFCWLVLPPSSFPLPGKMDPHAFSIHPRLDITSILSAIALPN